jgi:hypothetical protein
LSKLGYSQAALSSRNARRPELKQRGARFAYELTVQQYGMREFAVRDLNGYVLGFGEPTR